MAPHIPFSCKCGSVAGHVEDLSKKTSAKLTCFCKYCLGNILHLDPARTDIRDRGFVDLVQVDPEQIKFTAGTENLSGLKMSGKGPVRWFAKCCNTFIGGSLETRFPPFISLNAEIFPAGTDLGPIQFQAYCAHLPPAQRPAPSGKLAMARFIARFAKRAVSSGVTGRFKDNPFFDNDGKIIAPPRSLTKDEKTAAFAAVGIAKP